MFVRVKKFDKMVRWKFYFLAKKIQVFVRAKMSGTIRKVLVILPEIVLFFPWTKRLKILFFRYTYHSQRIRLFIKESIVPLFF